MPGESFTREVQATFVLEGSLDSFNASEFASNLASGLNGVDAEDIQVNATSASIRARTRIRARSRTVADSAVQVLTGSSAQQLSVLVGTTVESVSDVEVTTTRVAALPPSSPSPPSPAAPVQQLVSTQASNLEGADGSSVGSGVVVLLACLGVFAVITVVAVCWWLRRRREAPQEDTGSKEKYKETGARTSNGDLTLGDVEAKLTRSNSLVRDAHVPESARNSAYEAQFAALAIAERAAVIGTGVDKRRVSFRELPAKAAGAREGHPYV